MAPPAVASKSQRQVPQISGTQPSRASFKKATGVPAVYSQYGMPSSIGRAASQPAGEFSMQARSPGGSVSVPMLGSQCPGGSISVPMLGSLGSQDYSAAMAVAAAATAAVRQLPSPNSSMLPRTLREIPSPVASMPPVARVAPPTLREVKQPASPATPAASVQQAAAQQFVVVQQPNLTMTTGAAVLPAHLLEGRGRAASAAPTEGLFSIDEKEQSDDAPNEPEVQRTSIQGFMQQLKNSASGDNAKQFSQDVASPTLAKVSNEMCGDNGSGNCVLGANAVLTNEEMGTQALCGVDWCPMKLLPEFVPPIPLGLPDGGKSNNNNNIAYHVVAESVPLPDPGSSATREATPASPYTPAAHNQSSFEGVHIGTPPTCKIEHNLADARVSTFESVIANIDAAISSGRDVDKREQVTPPWQKSGGSFGDTLPMADLPAASRNLMGQGHLVEQLWAGDKGSPSDVVWNFEGSAMSLPQVDEPDPEFVADAAQPFFSTDLPPYLPPAAAATDYQRWDLGPPYAVQSAYANVVANLTDRAASEAALVPDDPSERHRRTAELGAAFAVQSAYAAVVANLTAKVDESAQGRFGIAEWGVVLEGELSRLAADGHWGSDCRAVLREGGELLLYESGIMEPLRVSLRQARIEGVPPLSGGRMSSDEIDHGSMLQVVDRSSGVRVEMLRCPGGSASREVWQRAIEKVCPT